MAVLRLLPACLTEITYIWVCFGSPLSLHKLYLCCWVQSPVYYTVSCDSRINDLEQDSTFFGGGGAGEWGQGKGTVMHWFGYNQTGMCIFSSS